MKSKIITLTIFMVAATLLVSACGSSTKTDQETTATSPTVADSSEIMAEGRVEPFRYADLALNANGMVSEVLVTEGEQVKAGQVIARLESTQAKTLDAAFAEASQELTTAYQEIRDARFKLDNFDAPSEFAGMTPSEAVEAMLTNLDRARADFEPYKNVDSKNLELTEAEKRGAAVVTGTAKIYKKALDSAWAKYRKAIQWLELESAVQNANTRLDQAQKDYDALQDPSFAEDTAGVRASLANSEVRAPFPGVITNLNLKVGEFAASGQPVVTIANISNWAVKTTDLTEIDVVGVIEGQAVTVTLDAIPGVRLTGNVFSISQNYSEEQGDIIYEVTVLLTDQNPAMRWGMTAEVKF